MQKKSVEPFAAAIDIIKREDVACVLHGTSADVCARCRAVLDDGCGAWSAHELRPVDVRPTHFLTEQTMRATVRAMTEQGGSPHQIGVWLARRDDSRLQVATTGVSVVQDTDRKSFRAATAGLHEQTALELAMLEPSAAATIAPTRRVE